MWARALAYRQFGGPEVLELVKTWVPEPGPGQVRVKVRAGGLNPIDGKLRAGTFSAGLPVLTATRLGSEFAGVVDAVGEGVEEFSPGDDVIGIVPERNGHVEAFIASADLLAPMPSTLSHAQGASIPAGGMTAVGALRCINVGTGDTVVVHGASGAVGSAAVQLARLQGAGTVIGTSSPGNFDWLRSLGVTPVEYGEGLGERLKAVIPQGPRVAMVDGAGREAVAESIGFVADPAADVITLLPFVDTEFGVQFNILHYDGADLREVASLYQDGSLVARDTVTFPLDQAAEAHTLLDSGHTGGKVVLVME